MTTQIAFGLMALIFAFFVLDAYVLHLDAGVFIGKKFIELINYLAIWR